MHPGVHCFIYVTTRLPGFIRLLQNSAADKVWPAVEKRPEDKVHLPPVNIRVGHRPLAISGTVA